MSNTNGSDDYGTIANELVALEAIAASLTAAIDQLPEGSGWRDVFERQRLAISAGIHAHHAMLGIRSREFDPAPGPVDPTLAELDAFEWREEAGAWQLVER